MARKPRHRRSRNGSAPVTKRLTPSQREARHRAFEAVGEMRAQGISLRAASEFAGSTPATVRRYANEALVKEGGR